MKLRNLLSFIPGQDLNAIPDLSVTGVFDRVQDVKENSIFVAVSGAKVDGHTYLGEAVARNASVLVVKNRALVPINFTGYVLIVENPRKTLGQLASHYYGNPSHHLFAVGITGTNGKTSLTYLIEHLLNDFGFMTGVIGTINHHLEKRVWPTAMTTPSSPTLQARIKEFKEEGATALAMEVSSHALHQYRVDGVSFNCVVFTNLTRDHLDYHENMESYFEAKQRLFSDLLWQSGKHPIYAVVNQDDEWGRKLKVADSAVLWTYGREPSDFRFQVTGSTFDGTEFNLYHANHTYQAFTPLIGLHNVYNSVAAMAVAVSAGMDLDRVLHSLDTFEGVPGRLQHVPNTRGLHIFVDYAHTPDALENVLKSLRQLRTENKESSKIWCIFGCGGDRDKGKRPMMGKIASELADFVVITSDNPRTENPESIIKDVQKGIAHSSRIKLHTEVDREKSFAWVLGNCSSNDIILVAGKGHEDYQIIGEIKNHFNDFQILKLMASGESLA